MARPRARDGRWRTSFGAWVARTTVPGVLDALKREGHPLTRKAVYSWLLGRTVPRLPVACALVKASRGRLTLDSIAAHAEAVRRFTPAPGDSTPEVPPAARP